MMEEKIYILGKGSRYIETAKYEWPYLVEFNPSNSKTPFILSEGVAHGAHSGAFSAKELLSSDWELHLKYTNTTWLIPILSEIVRCGSLEKKIILNEYKKIHAKEPDMRIKNKQ